MDTDDHHKTSHAALFPFATSNMAVGSTYSGSFVSVSDLFRPFILNVSALIENGRITFYLFCVVLFLIR